MPGTFIILFILHRQIINWKQSLYPPYNRETSPQRPDLLKITELDSGRDQTWTRVSLTCVILQLAIRLSLYSWVLPVLQRVKGCQLWQHVRRMQVTIPREGHVRDGEWSGHWAVGIEPGGGDSCDSLPMFGEEVTVLSFTLQKFLPHQGMETLNLSPLQPVWPWVLRVRGNLKTYVTRPSYCTDPQGQLVAATKCWSQDWSPCFQLWTQSLLAYTWASSYSFPLKVELRGSAPLAGDTSPDTSWELATWMQRLLLEWGRGNLLDH